MLIDTHAHLNFPDYEKDLDKVVARAIEVGVEKIICVSSNLADSQKAIEIAREYPDLVYTAVGIHPQQTDPKNKQLLEEQITILGKLAQEKEVVAIGECGLDFSPAPPGEKDRPHEVQIWLFQQQIELAEKLNLPLLIHSREAFKKTVESLKKLKGLRGVFHCYSAGRRGIEKVNQLGFYFGVGGNLTYDVGLQNVFRLIPLEKIVLETDCPFLAPTPFRGQRNEPTNIKIIAETLAKIKNASLEKIAGITFKNFQSLFSRLTI